MEYLVLIRDERINRRMKTVTLFAESQPCGPIADGAAGRAGGKALTALPGAAVCHFFQQRAALTHAGGGRGGKRNDGLAGEVVVLYEVVDRPRRNAPPDGIADEHGIILIPVCGGGLGQGDVPQSLVVMLTVDTAAVRPSSPDQRRYRA